MDPTTTSPSNDYHHIGQSSDSLIYRVAIEADCDSLATLVNISYRGELSKQGWTNENEFVDGPRTDADAISAMIKADKSIILVFFGATDKVLKGCVYLRDKSEIKTAYLGMLTVRPDLQGKGYGDFILSVAEKYAFNNWNVEYAELTVVLQRTELVAYYTRRDYVDTGEREVFPTTKFGHPKRKDLAFCTMRKKLKY
jgi:GNAT superfamily N-acetyltransferase